MIDTPIATSDVPNGTPSLSHERVLLWLERIIRGCMYVLVALIPLFFIPVASDVLELGKQSMLLILVSIASVARVAQMAITRSWTLSRSWLHAVALFFLTCFAIVSVFSQSRYVSFIGSMGQMQWAFVSVAGFVGLYFFLSRISSHRDVVQRLMSVFLAASTVTGVCGIAHLVGWPMLGVFGSLAATRQFNTVGTINSLATYMVLPAVLSTALMVVGKKTADPLATHLWHRVVMWASWVVALAILILIDYWAAWAMLCVSSALIVGISRVLRSRFSRAWHMVPAFAIFALALCLLLFRSPLNVQLPAEVSPSASASIKILAHTIKQHPFFGSGPGTWMFDYSKFRQGAVNVSPFWTIRFERGATTALTLPATVGIVGTVAWLLLLVAGGIHGGAALARVTHEEDILVVLPVFAAWSGVVTAAFFHHLTFSHHFAFWVFLGMMSGYLARDQEKKRVVFHHGGVRTVFVVMIALSAVAVMGLTGMRLLADIRYAQAGSLLQSGSSVQDAIQRSEAAVSWNPYDDAYARRASYAYRMWAQQLMNAPAATHTSPQIDEAIGAAIRHAERATEIAPSNVENWANSASLFAAVALSVPDADARAIDMFQAAEEREPNNPVFITEIGKIYLLRFDASRKLAQSKDEKIRQNAEQQGAMELEHAAEAFNQAIIMKSDYASAHYHLGLVYERQGRITDAIVKLEQVLRAETKNLGVAFQLAVLYHRHGDKEKALNVFEQIVAFDPTYANARWYLSSLYEEAGRYDDAIVQIQRLRDMLPTNEAVDRRLQELIRVRNQKEKPLIGPLPVPLREDIQSQDVVSKSKRR